MQRDQVALCPDDDFCAGRNAVVPYRLESDDSICRSAAPGNIWQLLPNSDVDFRDCGVRLRFCRWDGGESNLVPSNGRIRCLYRGVNWDFCSCVVAEWANQTPGS